MGNGMIGSFREGREQYPTSRLYPFNVIRFLVSLADRFASYQNFLFVDVYSTRTGGCRYSAKVFLFRRMDLEDIPIRRYFLDVFGLICLRSTEPLFILDHFLSSSYFCSNLIGNFEESINTMYRKF